MDLWQRGWQTLGHIGLRWRAVWSQLRHFGKSGGALLSDHMILDLCSVVQCWYPLAKPSLALRMRSFNRGLRAAVRLGRRISFWRRCWIVRIDTFSSNLTSSVLSCTAGIRGFFNTWRFNMLSVALWSSEVGLQLFSYHEGHLDGDPWQHEEVSLRLILIVNNNDKFI